jgi:hypothetical protein
MLRNQPFEPEQAGVAEQVRADLSVQNWPRTLWRRNASPAGPGHANQLRSPRGRGTCTRCWPHGDGPAFGRYPGCGNPRSYSPAQTTLLVNARLMTLLIRNAQLHVVDDGHLFIATRAAEMAQLKRIPIILKHSLHA